MHNVPSKSPFSTKLAAAHCVHEKNSKDILVVLAEVDIMQSNDTEQFFAVEYFIVVS